MYAFKLLPLILGAFAVALPAQLEERASTSYTDTFDDLQTSVMTPQLFPVGLYHGIQYGGVIVLLKRGPGVKSFNLQSFYSGLGTDTGSTAGLAQGGTIAVTDFDVNGKQVPTVSLSYAPVGTLNQPLKYAVLPDSYKNLVNVSIGVATSAPITERTYIALDDVKHVNNS
ncbi:MAG: hypothetical protein L6R41_003094 [Letrouitia leprolyta]|nr:MAG: hypothetical protein L6R41_003094 [Letrouitia leprolyta]